jgi:hypothetical protein
MDNELDQAISGLVSDDNKGGTPVAKAVDDPLDAALLDMFPTLPDF